MVVEIPRLMIKAWYPWNSMTGMTYMISLGYQVNKSFLRTKLSRMQKKFITFSIFQFYYLLFSMVQSNLAGILLFSLFVFKQDLIQLRTFSTHTIKLRCHVLQLAHLCLRTIAAFKGNFETINGVVCKLRYI